MHVLVMLANWLLTALATVFLWPSALPQTASAGTETVRQTLAWPAGATHALELSNISGSVHITGYDGRAVELVAVRTGQDRHGFSAADALAAIHMDMRTSTSGILVCADAEHCGCESDTWSDRGRRDRDRPQVDVAFELRVPRDTTLRACTINGKELAVDGLSGGFEVSNVNGALRLTNMSGTGSATTVNGGVTAEFTKNPTGDESFKTVNGDIEVHYPADLSADLRMKTMNGGMFTDFDVTARPTDAAALSPERRNGRFVYRGNSFANVRVGRGGPQLTFEGLNSRIEVLKRRAGL